MPTTRPVSDLRNYDEVLRDVKNGEPVFLTRNGKPRYVILDMEEYEKINATLRLMSELENGEQSAWEKGLDRLLGNREGVRAQHSGLSNFLNIAC